MGISTAKVETVQGWHLASVSMSTKKYLFLSEGFSLFIVEAKDSHFRQNRQDQNAGTFSPPKMAKNQEQTATQSITLKRNCMLLIRSKHHVFSEGVLVFGQLARPVLHPPHYAGRNQGQHCYLPRPGSLPHPDSPTRAPPCSHHHRQGSRTIVRRRSRGVLVHRSPHLRIKMRQIWRSKLD